MREQRARPSTAFCLAGHLTRRPGRAATIFRRKGRSTNATSEMDCILYDGMAVCPECAPLHVQEKQVGNIAVTSVKDASLAPFDRMMLIPGKHKIPGGPSSPCRGTASSSMPGFGHADREAGTPVQPNSLFRIASISKPITSAAVLQLAQGPGPARRPRLRIRRPPGTARKGRPRRIHVCTDPAC